MSKLHLCLISQEYPPDTGWGGIGSYTYEMAHGLSRLGHRVTVISRAVGAPTVVRADGVEVHRIVAGSQWSRLPGGWRLDRIWPGFAWAAMQRVRAIHRRTPIDVVEAAEGRADGLFLPLLPRRPRIVTRLHTAWIFIDRMNNIAPDRKKRFIYWQERRAIETADLVTSPSQAMLDLTRSWLPHLPPASPVIPNPVAVDQFRFEKAQRARDVLFVSRLERRKGLATIVAALPQMLARDAGLRLRFVGSDGTDEWGRSWREQLVAAAPGDLHRLTFDRVPRSDLAATYGRAGLSILPSVWENFPYALLEAMACGTPVVATRVGGVPELVGDDCGRLVPPDDPAALVEAIGVVFGDESYRAALGRNARQRAEALFSTERVVPQMLDAYRSVVDSAPRQRVIAWPA
jgi:glycosyltransferase involved in cell wall biosynthesis